MKQNSNLKSLDQFVDEQFGEKGTIKRDKLEKAMIGLTEELNNEIIEAKQ
jgi:hypothetical protein